MIVDLIAVTLMILGALFMLIASIGLVRMPDIYTRMHATTKSTSLGSLLVFTAASLVFALPSVWLKAIITLIFIFITAPIASHVMGRVAHDMEIPKWEETINDDLEEDKSAPEGNAD